jgi:hypothetical protein
MRKRVRVRRLITVVVILLACVVAGALIYRVPAVQDRLGWRIAALQARIKYTLFPPAEAVFTPDPTLAAMVQSTLDAITPTATVTPPVSTPPTPTITPTPSPTPMPIPPSAYLSGVRHEYEKWNNCGPATLAMTLSFWGWEGDQIPIADFVKPNPRDKNVMPYELQDFVEQQTDLRMIVRTGGTLDLIKRLIASGFPVMVEKGYDFPGADKGWMGHYQLIVGYDDAQARFTAYDSYTGGPNIPVAYDALESNWRSFNFTFLVPYPPEREEELLALLGGLADEQAAVQAAAQRASDEIYALTGRDQFFAWFNRGSSLVSLQDYAGAAAAYDEAFRLQATLDPETRPWRMLWYQTGPYWAYQYSGRSYDVISLATSTLTVMSEPVLEESYYWRGLARNTVGDVTGAIEDWRTAVQAHPGFEPALAQLQAAGVEP